MLFCCCRKPPPTLSYKSRVGPQKLFAPEISVFMAPKSQYICRASSVAIYLYKSFCGGAHIFARVLFFLSLSHVYFLWFISLSSIWISSKPLCLIETDCSAGSSPKQRDRRDYVERGEERARAFVITLNWRNIMGSSSGREIMCSWWPADLYWAE